MIPASLRRMLRRQAHIGTPVRTIILGAIVAVLATFCVNWYAAQTMRNLLEFSEEKPFVSTPREAIKADIRLIERRWREFSSARPEDHAVMEFSSDDCYTLLRLRTPLADGMELRMEKTRTRARFALPLGELPLVGEQMKGRYVNLSASLIPHLEGGVPDLEITSLINQGTEMTDEQRALARQVAVWWLRAQALPYRDTLARVKTVQKENGAFQLQQ